MTKLKLNLQRLLYIFIGSFLIIGVIASKNNVHASSYIYDFWKNVIPSTEGVTYKETYYNKDIINRNTGEAIPAFKNVTDMEIYDNHIYLLDQNKTGTTEIPLYKGADATSYKATGVSYFTIIDQDFKFENIYDEFLLSDKAYNKLKEYYHFDTPLNKITEAQATSIEFVDVFEEISEKLPVTNLSAKATNPRMTYTPELKNVRGTEFVVKVNGEVLPETEYTVSLDGTTVVTLKSNHSDVTEIEVSYRYIDTPGRAPYLPYSEDVKAHSENPRPAIRFSNALGITVANNFIYIADTENSRIVKIDPTKNFIVDDVYLTPDDPSFYQMYGTFNGKNCQTIKTLTSLYDRKIDDEEIFHPEKVAVTPSGVVYTIATNIYEGLIEFDSLTATFNRYLGKNQVTADPIKKILSKIYSEAQLKKLDLTLPPMFTNITCSKDGFLYATSKPEDLLIGKNMVKIINTKGNDILKRNGYVTPDGDVVFLTNAKDDKDTVIGTSLFTAVAVSDSGNFTVVDEKRGRLFTYDSEGNLLYITGNQPGGNSTQGSGNGLSNTIVDPVAVDYFYRTNSQGEEEETILVLDQYSNSLILFETTEFGAAVNTATELYQEGKIDGAEEYWRKVIKMNTNYELAYLGIGKALHKRGEYDEAMKYFKLAHNGEYYSKSFMNHRDAILMANFNLMMTVVIIFVIGCFTVSLLHNLRRKDAQAKAQLKAEEVYEEKKKENGREDD